MERAHTGFSGHRRVASGALTDVAAALREVAAGDGGDSLLVFEDGTGRVVDVDLRGSAAEVAARIAGRMAPASAGDSIEAKGDGETGAAGPRKRGRPALGVVGREVTLLPRHWSWLNAQPGGASVALRRLVDEARRSSGGRDRRRAAQERAYRFMTAMAGDLPGFEEALRALFADDRARFAERVAGWPCDVATYATQLAFGEEPASSRE